MGLLEKPLERCAKEARLGGIFGKKYRIALSVFDAHVSGEAVKIYANESTQHLSFDLPYEKITSIAIGEADRKPCLVIGVKDETLATIGEEARYAFPGLDDPEKWLQILQQARESRMQVIRAGQEKERLALLAEEQRHADALAFYNDCYRFHIKEHTPVYTLSSGTSEVFALYVGDDRSLNFLTINGYTRLESAGVIPFEHVHYYERAGNVSYTTQIRGQHSAYGGSFTGGSYSRMAAALGGVLFGAVGMAAGALFSHRQATMEASRSSFKLDSKVIRIDDRSTMLNFYSTDKKQYVDIELPQDCYNFLQTHLPEKKYGIVEELEKKAAVHQSMEAIRSGAVLQPGVAPAPEKLPEAQPADAMADFKMKIEKLRLLREAGMLTEDEFEAQRRKLLSQL